MTERATYIGGGPFDGYRLIVVRDLPAYVLPERITAEVPWPPGFRDGINRWAAGFFRPVPLAKGHEMRIDKSGRTIYASERAATCIKQGHEP